MYLFVQPTGTRSWIQRLVIRGRRRELGPGAAALVSLADARALARANRKLARSGGEPPATRVPPSQRAAVEILDAARTLGTARPPAFFPARGKPLSDAAISRAPHAPANHRDPSWHPLAPAPHRHTVRRDKAFASLPARHPLVVVCYRRHELARRRASINPLGRVDLQGFRVVTGTGKRGGLVAELAPHTPDHRSSRGM